MASRHSMQRPCNCKNFPLGRVGVRACCAVSREKRFGRTWSAQHVGGCRNHSWQDSGFGAGGRCKAWDAIELQAIRIRWVRFSSGERGGGGFVLPNRDIGCIRLHGVNWCKPASTAGGGRCTEMPPNVPRWVRFAKCVIRGGVWGRWGAFGAIFFLSPLPSWERVRGKAVELSGLVPQHGDGRVCESAQIDSTAFPLTPALSREGRGRMLPGDLTVHLQSTRARNARPLSLPARCAFVMTNAQRARARARFRQENGGIIFEKSPFCPAGALRFLRHERAAPRRITSRPTRRRPRRDGWGTA
jgi:hypothetical protein